MPDTGVASVQTIGRASMVLKALSESDSEGMRLSDVALAVGLGKSTISRLLRALIDVGYVETDELGKRYRLGYCLFNLGNAARRFHIIDLARPALARLAAATDDTVFLSLRDGDQAHCVDRQTGAYPIRTLTLSVGDRRPLGVGAGSLALLAYEPEDEAARIIATTGEARGAFTAYDDAALHQMVTETRARGFAFNDGHIVSAMNAVGVPVLDQDGRVVAALSLAAIRERVAPPRLDDLVALLRAEAEQLGGMIGRRRDARELILNEKE
ncbi:IclR family transcriptional regulator [Arenibacterium halophilum]|uniref:IclR family transcriptional regulator n=1 Tax=Arenibacterium halophilum TaxID=2583821 RepID=A0ABY2WZG8_9RHOB|nr:IclR family transcriptional regulator [Arenibacterium halophilum]TMV08297.1 IclR family transcriptional regulator [Arenibacterium halophilum]